MSKWKKTEKWIGIIGTAIVFAVFYIFLLKQFSKVFVYYDDFGYLSLSYAYKVEDVAGSEYNLRQLLEFMRNHYSYANGRLLCMTLYLLLYMAGGLKWVQVFMATVILLVVLLSFGVVLKSAGKAERRTKNPGGRMVLLAAFLCLLYGTIGVYVHRQGTYWYAAAFLYVVPAVTLLCFAWTYFRTDKAQVAFSHWILACVLAFAGAFSNEQWLVAVISFILAFCVWRLFKGCRLRTADGGVLLCACLGAMPILTSPAVRYRMETNSQFLELSFMERISQNIVFITRQFFSAGNKLYILTLLMMLIGMELWMLKIRKGNPVVHLLFLAATACTGIYEVWQLIILRSDTGLYPLGAVWLLFVYILWMSGQILYFLFSIGRELQALIYVGAFFSMACMVIVPEIPIRSMLPFILLSFSLMGTILWVLLQERLSAVIGLASLLAVGKISMSNLQNIYIGYYANDLVLQYNDALIRECSNRIIEGESIKEVKLYQLPNMECACEMVYYPNFSFMFYWMKEYYNIPGDLYLNYEVIPDIETLKVLEE